MNISRWMKLENSITRKTWLFNTINTIERNISDDLFISRISFEPRSIGILKRFNKEYKVNTGLFLFNTELLEYPNIKYNMNKIKKSKRLKNKFGQIFIEELEIDNSISPIMVLNDLLEREFKEKQKIRITFDITSFPRNELLNILYYLRNHEKSIKLRILYLSPRKYGKWLTKGYKSYITLPFFEGPKTIEKRIGLFILTGFEYERAISLIDEIEPSTLILGKPIPGTHRKFKDASEKIVDLIPKARKIFTKIHEVPANNPFKCKKIIQKLIKDNSGDYDFILTVLGTKLEAIGAFLAYEENPNFRIISSIPFVYNYESYSKGCRDIYEILLKPA